MVKYNKVLSLSHAKELQEMNKHSIDKKVMLCTYVLTGAIALSGCSDAGEEEKELAVFSSSVADFSEYIREADQKINSLDVSRKESADELLNILDEMNTEFAAFATITAPDQYASVPELAQQASEEMSRAVSFYHMAYEPEEFNENYADAAYQCYASSMNAVRYIGMLLLGEEILADDNITVYETTNDEHILEKWLSGGREDENETVSEGMSETVN